MGAREALEGWLATTPCGGNPNDIRFRPDEIGKGPRGQNAKQAAHRTLEGTTVRRNENETQKERKENVGDGGRGVESQGSHRQWGPREELASFVGGAEKARKSQAGSKL